MIQKSGCSNHLGCIKTPVDNGISTTNLKECRISESSTVVRGIPQHHPFCGNQAVQM